MAVSRNRRRPPVKPSLWITAIIVLGIGYARLGGQTGASAPAAPASKSTPAPTQGARTTATPVRTPTDRQRLATLPDADRIWLETFVGPIILAQERHAFLQLTQPHERDAFREAFWKRRENPNLQPPLGPGYRYRYEDLRRLAETTYDRWPNDAASMVLRHGEPLDIHSVEGCAHVFRDGLEIWSYGNAVVAGLASESYLFYRRSLAEPRRLWAVGTPEGDVFLPDSCRKTYLDLVKECNPPPLDPCPVCADGCAVFKVWSATRSRQGTTAGGQLERSRLLEPATVSLEGLDSIKNDSPNWSDPEAAKIGVEGPSATAPPDAEPKHELSRQEILEGIGRLEPKYRRFLDLAAPLMTEHEISDFLQLAPAAKDQFIADFWRRRK